MAKQTVVLTGLLTFEGHHVHRERLIEVLNDMDIEVIDRIPKKADDVTVVVGDLLKGRKTRVLSEAQKRKIEREPLSDFLTPQMQQKLRDQMEDASDLQPYEANALKVLQATVKARVKKH